MTEKKVSQAKRKANNKWDIQNRDRKNYINKRSTARNFIRTMEETDIPEFEQLLKERKEKAIEQPF